MRFFKNLASVLSRKLGQIIFIAHIYPFLSISFTTKLQNIVSIALVYLQTKFYEYIIFYQRYSLSDGHEQEQRRSDIKGVHTVVGFYKFVDPDGKSHQIYYKADDKGYQISYDSKFFVIKKHLEHNDKLKENNYNLPLELYPEPFEIEAESERLTDPSRSYLPPRENLISEIPETPSNSYLPPSNTYLPPN